MFFYLARSMLKSAMSRAGFFQNNKKDHLIPELSNYCAYTCANVLIIFGRYVTNQSMSCVKFHEATCKGNFPKLLSISI